jgi:hypothetical protein
MALQESHGLNSMRLRDKMLWTTQCPLIFYYAVEYHLPSTVIRQFGLEHPVRPQCMSISVELHRYVLNCTIYICYPSYLVYENCNFGSWIVSSNEVWRISSTTIRPTLNSDTCTSRTLWGSSACTLTGPYVLNAHPLQLNCIGKFLTVLFIFTILHISYMKIVTLQVWSCQATKCEGFQAPPSDLHWRVVHVQAKCYEDLPHAHWQGN